MSVKTTFLLLMLATLDPGCKGEPSHNPLSGPLVFPKIDRRPQPNLTEPKVLLSLPKYDLDSNATWQVDLRGTDLPGRNLRQSKDDLMYAFFDDRTF